MVSGIDGLCARYTGIKKRKKKPEEGCVCASRRNYNIRIYIYAPEEGSKREYKRVVVVVRVLCQHNIFPIGGGGVGGGVRRLTRVLLFETTVGGWMGTLKNKKKS